MRELTEPSTAQDTTVRCPCCGHNGSQLLGRLQDSRRFAGAVTKEKLTGGCLYRCVRCRLKFRFPIESAAGYSELYDHGEAVNWTGDIPRRDWDLIVQHVTTRKGENLRVLDFGCNTGELLARLGHKTEKFGIEINRAAADFASEKHGVSVWSSIDEVPPDVSFDIIVVVDVVEHVPNPAELMAQLLQRLAPGGELVITTGDAENEWWERFDANWWYCFHPEHIAFISRAWLDYLEKQGDVQIADYKLFRYRRLGALTQWLHAIFMTLYGVAPGLYLFLRNGISRLLSRPEVSSVLGNGVSADHLFVVLKNEL